MVSTSSAKNTKTGNRLSSLQLVVPCSLLACTYSAMLTSPVSPQLHVWKPRLRSKNTSVILMNNRLLNAALSDRTAPRRMSTVSQPFCKVCSSDIVLDLLSPLYVRLQFYSALSDSRGRERCFCGERPPSYRHTCRKKNPLQSTK